MDANWYDYPQYVDLLFRKETRREADFVETLAEPGPSATGARLRILDIGCGGGRLVCELAKRGHDVTGLDLSRPALRYLQKRLDRRGLRGTLLHADMADFALPQPVDVAINTWNTFRHLLTEAAARCHFARVERALRPGGLFILGLHLLPLDVAEEDEERWSARHGRTRVNATLRVLGMDRRRRLERLRLSLRVCGPRCDFRLRSEFAFRLYTPAQLRRFLERQRGFEVAGVYDFWFDPAAPRVLDDAISDTVVVLRRL
jgi:SAM-dependent methyltransferase